MKYRVSFFVFTHSRRTPFRNTIPEMPDTGIFNDSRAVCTFLQAKTPKMNKEPGLPDSGEHLWFLLVRIAEATERIAVTVVFVTALLESKTSRSS